MALATLDPLKLNRALLAASACSPSAGYEVQVRPA